MRSRTLTVRAIALLAAGAAAIHQLRYAIGYGGAAQHALAAHPHGYLAAALPAVLIALLIALGGLLLRTARGAGRDRRSGSFMALWLGCAFVLATIYGIQETVEGAGAFAGGGWIGLALSVPVGLLVALTLRGADVAESLRPAPAMATVFAVARSTPGLRPGIGPRRAAVRLRGARGPPLSFVI